MLFEVRSVVFDGEDGHRPRKFAIFACFGRTKHDGFAIRQVERGAFLPIFRKGDLFFAGAVGTHAPQIAFSVNLSAEDDPFAVRRDRDFRIVILIVRKPPYVVAVEVGNVEFGSLGIVGLVGPVTDGHVHIVAGRCPDQFLLIGKEIRTCILSAVVNAANIFAFIRKNISEASRASILAPDCVFVLGLRNNIFTVRCVIGLARRWNVRNLSARQLPALFEGRCFTHSKCVAERNQARSQ